MFKFLIKTLLLFCFFLVHPSYGLNTINQDGIVATANIETNVKSTWQEGIESVISAKQGATVDFTLNVQKEDIGFETDIFVVAYYLETWFIKNSQGQWLPWSLDFDNLTPYLHKKLKATEKINLITDFSLIPDEILAFVAYRAKSGELIFNQRPLSFAVINTEQNKPHHFTNQTTLENYLRETSRVFNNKDAFVTADFGATFLPSVETASEVSFGPILPQNSTTNLQEKGVDESDIIKTDGNILYVLSRCIDSYCLRVYQIQSLPTKNKLLSETPLELKNQPTGMFLVDSNQDEKMDTLILISNANENQFSGGDLVSIQPFYYGGDILTELTFFDVQNPSQIVNKNKAVFKGSLLSSRVIEKTLYLVTRYTPTIFYTETIDTEIVDNTIDIEGEVIDTDLEIDSIRQKAQIKPNKEDIPPLPEAMIDDVAQPQIKANQCYLPIQSAEATLSNSITSLIAIPISNPTQFDTTCIMGDVDAMYASPQHIYLTSSRGQRTNPNPSNELSFDMIYSLDYATDIHQFVINDQGKAPIYNGSATAKGHLGWKQDQKSFRMGESQDTFFIATSIGDTWQNNSSTRVTVFQSSEQNGLVETGHLDHLGKPGEKLYAARFTGNRGYLVTFRTIDPLYVLDLSDPTAPKVAGELEIEGYSDFLQPLNDQFILGIGKDAVPDVNARDFSSSRGAWYQGLKLSLFDVSDLTTPTEVDKIIIGKRGTESAALNDHHALSLLTQNAGLTTRIALPIQLHEEEPQNQFITNNFSPPVEEVPNNVEEVPNNTENPSAYYGWTSQNLYVLDIDLGETPRIEIKMILNNGDTELNYKPFSDRSVLVQGGVHYISNGNIISADIDSAPSAP